MFDAKKIYKLFSMKNYILQLTTITLLSFCIACGSDDGEALPTNNDNPVGDTGKPDDGSNTVKEKSITKANFPERSASVDNGFHIIDLRDGGINNNWKAQITVEDYNSEYNYEFKIKGDVFKKEYTAPLTFEKNDELGTILKFDVANFNADVDTYQGFVIEKESNTEIKIESILSLRDDRPYIILDSDEGDFLPNITFRNKANGGVLTTELSNEVAGGQIYIFPAGGGGLSGLNGLPSNLKLVVYDKDLNNLGNIEINKALTNNSVRVYAFDVRELEAFITDDYLVRLESGSTKKSPYVSVQISVAPRNIFTPI